jgi:hypothetical protein
MFRNPDTNEARLLVAAGLTQAGASQRKVMEAIFNLKDGSVKNRKDILSTITLKGKDTEVDVLLKTAARVFKGVRLYDNKYSKRKTKSSPVTKKMRDLVLANHKKPGVHVGHFMDHQGRIRSATETELALEKMKKSGVPRKSMSAKELLKILGPIYTASFVAAGVAGGLFGLVRGRGDRKRKETTSEEEEQQAWEKEQKRQKKWREEQNKKECKDLMCRHKIYSKKDYNQWALGRHPDKFKSNSDTTIDENTETWNAMNNCKESNNKQGFYCPKKKRFLFF